MEKIKLYNYLTRKVEVFNPLKKNRVHIYACGPTVYDYVHIGNLRTFLFEDFLRRMFEYLGFRVKMVMNITDIDDKIIKKANQESKKWYQISRKYEKFFFKDLEELNIKPATYYPRASAHIKEMINLIKKLEKNGLAYKTEDGVYFDISKYPNYGVLVDLKKIKTKKSRIIADDYQKEELADFALWKFKKPNEPSWPSPWGKGRPGWHIECSAMSIKYLGIPFDIHCGGIDLLFPHHENEIAQSEGAYRKKFVNFFVEGEHLLVEGRKMSKRFNNFYTLRDIKNKNFSPLAFRYLALSSHYQSKLNFTFNSLEAAQNNLKNLWSDFSSFLINQSKGETSTRIANKYEKSFKEFITNNLNTPKALTLLHQLVKENKLNDQEKSKILLKWDKFFALGFKDVKEIIKKKKEKIKSAKALLKERNKLRKKKRWNEADSIRKKINEEGFIVEDKPGKTILRLEF